MPPKSEPLKDQKEAPIKSSIEDSSDITDKPADEPEDPLPGPSTSAGFSKTKPGLADKPPPTEEDIRKSPVCRMSSDTIRVFERDVEDDPVASEVEKLHKAEEPFEKIIMFYIGKRRFSDDQRKLWVAKINDLRRQRSLSSIPTDYETKASEEVAHLKFSPQEIEQFIEDYQNEDYWGCTESEEKSKTECNTSSDSEPETTKSEKKSPRLTPRRSPRHQGMVRKGSWKEYKKGKNFGSAYLKRQVEHTGVKKVIKKIVKEIYRKKKRQLLKKKEQCSIEVGEDEVHDFLMGAAGYMAEKYIREIEPAARKVYPPADSKFESEYESGTYDSQDEWYPNKETASSRLNKMSVSVPPSTLQEYGLLDILISVLPMTINDLDAASVLEFVNVLKMARNRVPEHITIKVLPKLTPEKEKPSSGQTVVCVANIELPPDLERLERTGAEGYLKQIPTQDDDESNSITKGVKNSLKLESSETESSIKIEITEASGDIKFIDESSAEEADSTEHLKRDRSPKSPDTQSKRKAREN